MPLNAEEPAISKDNAEHYKWGQKCDGWYLVKNEQIHVIQERMPPGAAETLHKHAKARQFFFVLAGTALMESGGRNTTLAAGAGLEIPPGTPHRIVNKDNRDLEFLVISQPPSHGDRLELNPGASLRKP